MSIRITPQARDRLDQIVARIRERPPIPELGRATMGSVVSAAVVYGIEILAEKYGLDDSPPAGEGEGEGEGEDSPPEWPPERGPVSTPGAIWRPKTGGGEAEGEDSSLEDDWTDEEQADREEG